MPKDENGVSNETAIQFVSLAEAADLSGLSHSHLRLLVRQDKIWGIKIGRDWLTTKEAVKAYLATERRPGRKPDDTGKNSPS